jgi:hypothetical protein
MRITPVIFILSEKNVMAPGRNIEAMRPAVNKKMEQEQLSPGVA